jgi:uncharacterized protein YjiS (DUF1127 family)
MPEHPSDGSAAGAKIPARTVLSHEENSSALAVISLTVSMWLDRRRRRQALQDLAERNNYLLADVGLTQEEALREAAKPFWRR